MPSVARVANNIFFPMPPYIHVHIIALFKWFLPHVSSLDLLKIIFNTHILSKNIFIVSKTHGDIASIAPKHHTNCINAVKFLISLTRYVCFCVPKEFTFLPWAQRFLRRSKFFICRTTHLYNNQRTSFSCYYINLCASGLIISIMMFLQSTTFKRSNKNL